MTDELEPISPSEAREMYIDSRSDIAESTRISHEKRINVFVRWCEANKIDNLNELGGRDLHRYKIGEFAEKENGEAYSEETVRGYQDTLREFLRFVESIDGVQQGLAEKVKSPRPGESRDEELASERAEEVLENLSKYEYSSLEHAFVHLMWRTAARVGTLRGIDIDDVDLNKKQIRIQHRPREDTPLKNQWTAERRVSIKNDTASILGDYIQQNRNDTADEHGREPLFTSKKGRRSISNLREITYRVTRPCEWTGECPHGRDIGECDAARRKEWASQCPSSVSPHPVRRGSITHMLRSGVPKTVVADRSDVSAPTLDKHYNQLTEVEKAERRRDYLDEFS